MPFYPTDRLHASLERAGRPHVLTVMCGGGHDFTRKDQFLELRSRRGWRMALASRSERTRGEIVALSAVDAQACDTWAYELALATGLLVSMSSRASREPRTSSPSPKSQLVSSATSRTPRTRRRTLPPTTMVDGHRTLTCRSATAVNARLERTLTLQRATDIELVDDRICEANWR